jgi:alkyl sulfatase BDS1-like metallo-beta-lactamase superfamily hydrolase
MATSVRDFFDRRVPEALQADPERAKNVSAIYLFKIAGAEGGTWTANLLASPPWCRPGVTGEPQCTIEISDRDFCAMVDGGAQAAMQFLMAGKLKIVGDPTVIAKLVKVLQIGG